VVLSKFLRFAPQSAEEATAVRHGTRHSLVQEKGVEAGFFQVAGWLNGFLVMEFVQLDALWLNINDRGPRWNSDRAATKNRQRHEGQYGASQRSRMDIAIWIFHMSIDKSIQN